jgi:hypothetical protein
MNLHSLGDTPVWEKHFPVKVGEVLGDHDDQWGKTKTFFIKRFFHHSKTKISRADYRLNLRGIFTNLMVECS